MQATGKSHIGKVRAQNQDAFYVSKTGPAPLPNLFVVADGLGGHNSGGIASNGALAAFCDYFENRDMLNDFESFLSEALTAANLRVFDESLTTLENRGMGTTFTAATIHDETLYFVHVGDSRIYITKRVDGVLEMEQITNDHFTRTADMVADGILTEDEAKNYPETVLSRAVGTDPDVNIDRGRYFLKDAEHILMCSDGLSNMLSNEEILQIIENNNENFEQIAEKLVEAANDAGGRDNITVIAIGGVNNDSE